jgi:hypothetical protein
MEFIRADAHLFNLDLGNWLIKFFMLTQQSHHDLSEVQLNGQHNHH